MVTKIKDEVKKVNKEHIRESYSFYEDIMQDYILTDEVKKNYKKYNWRNGPIKY